MPTNVRTTRKDRPFTLAAASEVMGTVVGRAVGRVERIVKLARQRLAGRTMRVSFAPSALRPRSKPRSTAKKRAARPARKAARTRA